MSSPILQQIYFAFVHAHIVYNIELCVNSASIYFNRLIAFNNKLLQILQNKTYNCTVTELCGNYNTSTLTTLHQFQLLFLVHKYVHHRYLLPNSFTNYIVLNRTIHKHDNRIQNNVHLGIANKHFGKRRLRFNTSTICNSLTHSLKQPCSTEQFTKLTKLYFQNKTM